MRGGLYVIQLAENPLLPLDILKANTSGDEAGGGGGGWGGANGC